MGRRESGFGKYLYETLREDREVAALSFKEVERLPEPSRSRLLKKLGRLKAIRKLHRLWAPIA